jgi:hypothetical protein
VASEDATIKTFKRLTKNPSYSSFSHCFALISKNVIFEKNHSALSKVIEAKR